MEKRHLASLRIGNIDFDTHCPPLFQSVSLFNPTTAILQSCVLLESRSGRFGERTKNVVAFCYQIASRLNRRHEPRKSWYDGSIVLVHISFVSIIIKLRLVNSRVTSRCLVHRVHDQRLPRLEPHSSTHHNEPFLGYVSMMQHLLQFFRCSNRPPLISELATSDQLNFE